MPGVYQDLVSLSELRELVMDREAWRAVIHGVSKSWIHFSGKRPEVTPKNGALFT